MTFEAAVKHLFRHFHDVKVLRTNPIAAPFLEPSSSAESPYPARQGLAELRAQVMQLAERFQAEDAKAGIGVRAARRLAIVRRHYFDGVPMQAVARALNVSVKHCYRERAAICRRIARVLSRRDGTDVVVSAAEDGFYFLLDRLLASGAQGASTAFEACEYLQSVAKTPSQRLAAEQAYLILAIRSGDRQSAEAAYARALRLHAEQLPVLTPELERTAEARMNYVASVWAYSRGQTDIALAAAERAVEHLESGPIEQTAHAELLQVRARFNLCALIWARGDLAGAYDALSATAARCGRLPPSTSIRIRVEGSIWKLRTYLLLNNSFTLRARLEGLVDARERALRSGALYEAIDAMVSITECHVFAGRDARALQSARGTLRLVASAPPLTQMKVALDLGVRLLSTKFWQQALDMLPDERLLHGLDDYHTQLLSYAIALAAFRSGDVEKARRFSAADPARDRWANLDVRRGLVAAESAYLLGHKAQAYEAAEMAVVAAEQLGAAPLLRDAYEVCGRILARPRVGAQAKEIERILAA
jgi:hypothetical protein